MAKKLIGITCDNYKVNEFLKAFKEANIEVVKQVPLLDDCMLIQIFEEVDKAAPIIGIVEGYFKARRETFN